jgi:hypothetical protein
MNKAQEFIDCAFSVPSDQGVKCPCSRCRNTLREDKRMLTPHLCKFGFMSGYEVWTHHGEIVHQRTTFVAKEDDDRSGGDKMDEVFDAIRPELETNSDDPPTPEVQKFFDMHRASEETLHEHTIVSVLIFVTRLTVMKSKFTFSNKCYKDLLSLISDVLPSNHKMPKEMHQSKKLLSVLGMEYEKIDACEDNYMLFYKVHKDETKCLKCGKSRFIEVINEDAEKVTMKVAHKQFRYMPLVPQMKWLFLSKKTVRHMRWRKQGVRENDQVMVHLSDSDAWKALDDFEANFTRDARNVRIGLAMDGFSPYNMSAASYSCWPVFAILYNLPSSLCMKYKYIFLCLLIHGPDHPAPRINVMLKPLIEEFKQLWEGAEAYDYDQKQKFNLRVAYLWSVHDFRAYNIFQVEVAMEF